MQIRRRSLRRQLLTIWLAAALGFAVLLLAHQVTRSRLSDPDPARQRPDFLGANHSPFPAPAVTASVPTTGRRAVVFFTRPRLAPSLLSALSRHSSLEHQASLVVVVPSPVAPLAGAAIPVVVNAGLAARFHLDRPVDGGAPVGYAVIGSAGLVPYETLDPAVADHLLEVATVLGATR